VITKEEVEMSKTFEEQLEEQKKQKKEMTTFVEYASRQMVEELGKDYPNKARVNRLRVEINRAIIDFYKEQEW